MQNDVMYLGRVIAESAPLSSKRVIDSDNCDLLDTTTDAYGNIHTDVIKLSNGSNINYNLEGKYSLLKLKIAIDEKSYKDYECTLSISADGEDVKTIPNLNKISTKEIECKDIEINNCSRLEIKCTGDYSIYPIIYDAEVYN